MPENIFRSHFWTKSPPPAFCLKITFDSIYRHFKSLRNFFILTWPPAVIFEARKSYFLSYSRNLKFICNFSFLKIFLNGFFIALPHHFRTILNLFIYLFISKMAPSGRIGCRKVTKIRAFIRTNDGIKFENYFIISTRKYNQDNRKCDTICIYCIRLSW